MAKKKTGPGAAAARRKKTKKPTGAKAAPAARTPLPEAATPVPHRAPGTSRPQRTLRTVADLQAGDHLCCIYETEAEHRAILTPYLRLGLERGEKIIYVVDAHTAETVLDYLRDDGLDPAPFLARGQLAILSRDETYLRGGTFFPAGMIALLRKETEQALAEGYQSLRVTGEMTWALRGHPGSERLIEYEVLLNEFFPGSRCQALCQYDRRRFEPGVLLYVLRTHPYVVVGSDVCENPHYLPPTDLLSTDSSAAELSRWLRGLTEQRRTLHELRVHQAELEAQNEELRLAQAELDAARARYFDLYDLAPVGYCTVSEAGLILEANLPTTTLLGVAKGALIGQRFSRFIIKEDEGIFYRHRKLLLETAAPQAYELRMVRADGAPFWAHLEAIAAQDEGGAPICRVVLSDISDRKRAEAALRQSEERYRSILDASPDVYAIADLEGRITMVSPVALPMFGSAREQELLGHSITDFIAPEDRDKAAAKIALMFQGIMTGPAEYRGLRADGSTFDLEANAEFVRGADGQPASIVFVVRDVTERKRAEADLRKLASVVHASSELVNLSTLEGKMIFLNEAGSRMLGISPDAVEQFDVRQVIPAHLKEKVETELLPAIRRGGAWTGELQYLNIQTGRLTDVHASCYVVRDAATGAPLFLANVSRDITEGKRAAAALRQSETRFGALVAQSPFSIQILDTTGKTIQVNRAFEDLWGTTFEQTRDFNPLEDEQLQGLGLRPYLQRAFSGEAVECPPVEYIPRVGDVPGLRRVVQAIAFPIKDEAGVVREVTLIHQDVTERRRAEAALAGSRLVLERVQEMAHLGSWEIALDTKTVTASPEAHRIYGLTGGVETLAAIQGVVLPEYRPALDAALTALVAAGSPYDLQFRIRRPTDGAVRHIHSVAGYDAEHRRVTGYLEDITERQRAEELSRAQHDLAQALSSTTSLDTALRLCLAAAISVSEMDAGGIYLVDGTSGDLNLVADVGLSAAYVADAAHYQADSANAQLVQAGQPIYSRHQALGSSLDDARRREGLHAIAIVPVLHENRVVACLNVASHTLDDAPVFARGALETIAAQIGGAFARLRAERELLESEERYRTLVESALDGIVIHVGDRVAFANKAAAAMLGFAEPAAFVGQPLESFVHPDDLANAADRVRRVLAGETVAYPVEARFLRRDGTDFPVENTGVLVTYEGRPALLSVIRDITARKRAEEALRNSLSLIEATLESTDNGILVVNREGAVVKANARFAAMWGVPEHILASGKDEALIDHVLSQLSDPDAFLAKVKELYGDPQADTEDLLPFKDGRVFERTSKPMLVGGEPVARVWSFLDVSERQRSAEALRRSEARYRRITEGLTDYQYTVRVEDGHAVETTRGQACARVTGYTTGEYAVNPYLWIEMVTPEDRDRVREHARRVLAGEDLPAIEHRIVRKDGTVRWVSDTAILFKDDSGRLLSYEGVISDITERKRSEAARGESEARLRSIFRVAPTGIGVVRDRVLLEVNELVCEMTGRTREELIGKSSRVFYPTQEEFEYVGREKYRQIAERGTGIVETRWMRKDGSAVDVLLSSTPIDPSDHSTGVTFTALDITERKRAVEALRLSEERHRHLVESSDDWVWETDANAVITFASARVTDLLGYTPEEVVGRLVYDLMPPEDAERARAAFGLRVAERQAFRGVENTNLHKNGRRVVMESNGVPLFDASGAFRGYRGVDTDITERKLLQAEFMQAQKMESVGRLAGGIAHDFNNLLSVINGYAELAASDRSLNNLQRAQIVAIHRAGQRAATLTQQLLSFSRRQAVAPVVLDLNVAIRTAQKMLERLIGEDISLIFAPTEPLGGVEADPGQIEQVVMNLVVNARDAMPEGGMLSIETAGVELDQGAAEHASVQPGTYVMLAVSDTGVGMDEATREHIFEPFFTTKGLGKGTGLGLAIVYGIVRQSHGGIRVASIPGQGTTFTLYFPQAQAPVPQDGPSQPPLAVVGGTETILVVEDEDSVRALATDLLKSAGYTVLPARDGEEALQVLERHGEQVKLVFSDMVMPGMSGLALAEELAKTRPELRVLFTSGYDSGSIARGGIPHGATHFISKPYTVAGLSRKVREVLDWLW